MRKLNSIIILSFLLFLTFLNSFSQEGKCGKTKVGLFFIELGDNVIDHLNKKYGTQSKEAWIDQIDAMVLDALKNNSPELEFFSRRKDKNTEPDYNLRYTLHLTVIDGKLLFPSQEIIYTDEVTGWEVTEYTDRIYSKETAFWMSWGLAVNSSCIPCRNWLLAVELSSNIDISQVIADQSRKFWRITSIIEAHEGKRPVPAREPELEISFEKEFLSLLDEESRKMDLKAKVKNCKGEYVYYRNHSQPTYFQDDVNRCELSSSKKCSNPTHYGNHMVILTNKDYEAIGIYKVTKGIHPSKEKLEIGTCGIGSNSEIFVENELIIRGLEIEVKPRRKEIYANEQTDIRITFYEVDPEGNKYPVGVKKLEIKIKGIVNGSISPAGEYVTDINGTVTLNYRAGDQDKNIIITASFQPPKYSEKVEGQGSVRVKTKSSYEWKGSLSISINKTFSCNYSYQENQNIDETDVETYGVDMQLTADNIEIGQVMTARLDKTNLIATGEYRTAKLYERSHNIDWKDHHTYDHKTLAGQNSFDLSAGNIGIQFFKQLGADPERLKQKAMEVQKHGYDIKKLQKFKKEMQEMLQGNANNPNISAMIIINGDFVQKLKETNYRHETDASGKVVEESNENMVENHAPPVQIKCEGQYIKGNKGNDKIIVTYNETKEVNRGKTGSKCPPVHVNIKASLNLERQVKNK